jgi:segregation and condensation protein A
MHQIRLEVFTGPMDLLLHLIRKNEIDIFDIPIHKITQEYLYYLSIMPSLNLEGSGEFLVMAAILMQIKSRMLLPRPQRDHEPEEGEDPREELVRMLLEYKGYKEAASLLRQRLIERERVYIRPGRDGGLVEANLYDLIYAFHQLVQPRTKEIKEIEHEEISIDERMASLLAMFNGRERLWMEEIFLGLKTKMEFIVTFLALLELIRIGRLRATQDSSIKRIWISMVRR